MNINTSISAYSYTTTSFDKKSQSSVSNPAKLDADSVTAASTAAGSAANAAQDAKAKSTFVQDLPDEAYAIPAWRTGYYEDVSSTLIMGLPGNYAPAKSAGFAAGTSADNIEYGNLLQKHVKDTYEKNGLLDATDRYKALSLNKGLEEQIHKQFTASVSADPRMMELMGKLGVALS